MKYILSRYNHDVDWVYKYTKDPLIYDRSEEPLPNTIIVPNIGSDIYDKLSYIIDNYDNLPPIAVYTKANLFKYITQREFNKVKESTKFTPLLTKKHKTYMPVCFYDKDGMYNEINNYWYLAAHPPKSQNSLAELLQLINNVTEYHRFAPGSNYILTRENILQHTKVYYMYLRSFLDWAVYPGEAQVIERNMYHIFK